MHTTKIKIFTGTTIVLLISTLGTVTSLAEKPPQAPAKKTHPKAVETQQKNMIAGPSLGSDLGDRKEPTFIESKTLTLDSEKRIFTYSGDVNVKKGDMTLKADTLVGNYSETNEIEKLIATGNVDIVKGADLHATSQKAVYDANQDLMTLTDNPEITQKGSTLNADVVKIFVKENKSLAEGSVRMKVLQSDDGSPVSAGLKLP